ncbi:response regulator [Natronocalculus amylovorans]|uniref:Response regulator n=1 Tax=Natronocalculus amylovorans TaxID=2917812 RepID=A0AAE3K8S1_9EURY|nr:response regulator [Natronocalculus amylovorans]MCL9816805.1 response regulator [Natronocalculus amylovorans]NUE01245.1 response regulator [Halorubraceae archaeon YAN]
MTKRVLIVDDSALQRSIIKEVLKDEFEIVGEAENGKEAVKKYLQTKPDLITMDIMMPELNGIEATAKIKEQSPETVIVMCTSVGQDEKMREAVTAGADGYVLKPLDEEELFETVTNAVS